MHTDQLCDTVNLQWCNLTPKWPVVFNFCTPLTNHQLGKTEQVMRRAIIICIRTSTCVYIETKNLQNNPNIPLDPNSLTIPNEASPKYDCDKHCWYHWFYNIFGFIKWLQMTFDPKSPTITFDPLSIPHYVQVSSKLEQTFLEAIRPSCS